MWKKALLQYNAVDFGVHKYAKTKDVVLHSIIQQSMYKKSHFYLPLLLKDVDIRIYVDCNSGLNIIGPVTKVV